MNNNVITVDLNASPRTISRPLYQYDQGVKLYLKGAGVPALCQVHFSNDRELGAAIPMTCESGFVDVPPQLLRSGRALNFWVCDQTEDEELYTVDAMTVPVVRRPLGVAEAPSAEQASALDQAIAAANRAAAAAESSLFTVLEGSVTLTQTSGQPDQWTDIVLPDFDAIEDLPHTILMLTVTTAGTAAPVTILMTAPQTKNWWCGMTALPNWVLTLTASTRRFTLDGFALSSEYIGLAGALDDVIGRLDSLEESVPALNPSQEK